MRKRIDEAARSISFPLLVLAAVGCQNKPSFESPTTQASAEQTIAERDAWWNNQIQQKIITPEEVTSEPKVKNVVERIKVDPYIGCGYTLADNPDMVDLAPVALNNARSKIVSGIVTVMGSGSINLSGKQNAITVSNSFRVISTSPNNAEGRAVNLANKASGMTKFQNLSQVEVQAALKTPADKPMCGIVMARGLRATSADGATYVQATFSKPIVTIINPKVSVERLKLQLATPIKVTGITATLESNDEEVIAAGLVKQGDIEVTLIPTSRTLKNSLDQDVTINSEVAYRIANKFQGEGAETSPSVLDQVADYYITGNKITHIVVLTPLPELPIIVYQTP